MRPARAIGHIGNVLAVLDGMMSVDFYSINRALRGSGTLDRGCGAYLDWEGWESQRQFAEAAHLAFYDLWHAGALGTSAGKSAFRGCTFERGQMEGSLRSGYLIDHGYGFATAYREEAESHLSEEGLPVKGIYCEEGQPLVPVLFEIQIGRSSLYLPAKDEPDPFGLRTGFMLERQSGQFILERYSMLKIREVSRGDVVHVRCEQRL